MNDIEEIWSGSTKGSTEGERSEVQSAESEVNFRKLPRQRYSEEFISVLELEYAKGKTAINLFPLLQERFPEYDLTKDRVQWIITRRQKRLNKLRDNYREAKEEQLKIDAKENYNRVSEREQKLIAMYTEQIDRSERMLEQFAPWEKGYSQVLSNLEKMRKALEELGHTKSARKIREVEAVEKTKKKVKEDNEDDISKLAHAPGRLV